MLHYVGEEGDGEGVVPPVAATYHGVPCVPKLVSSALAKPLTFPTGGAVTEPRGHRGVLQEEVVQSVMLRH